MSLPPWAAHPALPELLRRLGPELEVFLVGGCLRDSLLGLPVSDYDLLVRAADLDAPALLSVLRERLQPARLDWVGESFGVVKLRLRTPTGEWLGETLDLAFPSRGGRQDLRLPLEADLGRRDFTVNALAYRLTQSAGWVDPFGGRRDLAERRLQAVGHAKDRFGEDPVRVLRAARFIARFGLVPDLELCLAARQAEADVWQQPPERIFRELAALLDLPRPADGFDFLQRAGLTGLVAPGDPRPWWAALGPLDRWPAADRQVLRWSAWLAASEPLGAPGPPGPEPLLRLRAPGHLVRECATCWRCCRWWGPPRAAPSSAA
ncbi:hypothetical protein ACFP81_12030 [Deinococcus lacus]|uniref:Poly A polymerase head domain-containing protein n=1 Tax=Deinococcus lacus TaxID=392561 RepID=A0ABW1YGH5_9DEIO